MKVYDGEFNEYNLFIEIGIICKWCVYRSWSAEQYECKMLFKSRSD